MALWLCLVSFRRHPYLNPDGRDNVVMVRRKSSVQLALVSWCRTLPQRTSAYYRLIVCACMGSEYHHTLCQDDFATVRIRTLVNAVSPTHGVRVDTEIINRMAFRRDVCRVLCLILIRPAVWSRISKYPLRAMVARISMSVYRCDTCVRYRRISV